MSPNVRPSIDALLADHALVTAALVYLAVGAAFFAHPPNPARPDDFDWRNQIDIFRATLPEVLAWPVALWRFGRSCFGPD